MVRDARRCRAPHHEGLRAYPGEPRISRGVSKDEAPELENALIIASVRKAQNRLQQFGKPRIDVRFAENIAVLDALF